MTEILIATRNAHKLREIRAILSGTGFTAISIDDIEETIPPIVEDGETFLANAEKKAGILARLTGRTAVADDSGLVVDALDGAPGVFSARWAGLEGPGADVANNALLMRRLQGVPGERRTARYCCAIAVVTPGGRTRSVEATCEGSITDLPRGRGGFGYDPHFLVAGDALGRTMAELSEQEKNAISHRGKALRAILPLLRELHDR